MGEHIQKFLLSQEAEGNVTAKTPRWERIMSEIEASSQSAPDAGPPSPLWSSDGHISP
jgi:hypothetical protein